MNGWAAGFSRYLASYEVRLHRRMDTFGGVVWPVRVSGLVSPERQLEIAVAAGRGRVA
ncbi:hypothetical protein [Microbacterium sp. 5K110]|uniref:hypothetical protein n=1 Tax=Microbacterium sp. 5K110 TaxID=2578104 RepID=UPI0014858FE8|nr:hypothetical protein [Microbacterium sp. 5K110]